MNMHADEPLHTDEPTQQIAISHTLRELEQDAMNAKRLADWRRRYWHSSAAAPAPVTPGWPCVRSAITDNDPMPGQAIIGAAVATGAHSLEAVRGEAQDPSGFVVNLQIAVVPNPRGVMLEFRHPVVTAA